MGCPAALASPVLDVEEQPELLPRIEPAAPFRVLVLGDFSGRAHRGLFHPAWEGRRPVTVDRDRVDMAMRAMAPEVEIPLDEEEERVARLAFSELAGFHPDRLAEALADDAARRTVIDHPDFRALEAAWRGVDYLARGLEAGRRIQIALLDVSKAELAASLIFCDAVEESAAYRLLVEEPASTFGAHGRGVVAGLYAFDAGPQDLATLARMAAVARMAETPFVAQASARMAGCESFAASPDPRAWSRPHTAAVRRRRDARWLGLAAPRFLLRPPYEPEEEAATRERCLWGNPALVCVRRLARMVLGGGEPGLPECAEVAFSDEAVERLLSSGIMPLETFTDAGRARMARFQSFADPPAPLAGAWQ